ncbi:MAG: hypothetical protein WCG51_03615 [Elusimicrobiota bacterium]
MGTLKPKGWGNDDLTEFFDASRMNSFATFVQFYPEYSKILDIDNEFKKISNNLDQSENQFCVFLLHRSHSAYRASAQLAISGQIPEAYMVLRGCLENALYGFYFHFYHDALSVWLDRNSSDKAKQKVKNEIRPAGMLKLLKEKNKDLGNIATSLYDMMIDYGAHPNPNAIRKNMSIFKETDGTIVYRSKLLSGNTPELHQCIELVSRTGVCCLQIFMQIYKERFDSLDITARLNKISVGL